MDEVLSEEKVKKDNEMDGIFQVGIFWVGIFRVGIFPGGIFLEPHFVYTRRKKTWINFFKLFNY